MIASNPSKNIVLGTVPTFVINNPSNKAKIMFENISKMAANKQKPTQP
jgi:hypothetical protein